MTSLRLCQQLTWIQACYILIFILVAFVEVISFKHLLLQLLDMVAMTGINRMLAEDPERKLWNGNEACREVDS